VNGWLCAALGTIGGFGLAAVGDMVSEEVRDRLDHLPHAILRLAACLLDPMQRATVYEDEWLPELTYILKGDEARPVTRLYHGTRFAIGILLTARRIAEQLNRALVAEPAGRDAIIMRAYHALLDEQLARLQRMDSARTEDSGVTLAELDREITETRLMIKSISGIIDRAECSRFTRRALRACRETQQNLLQILVDTHRFVEVRRSAG
jgi:hypothetical protein